MRFPLLLLTTLLATTLCAKITSYTADNSTNFCNPERGFYLHVEQSVSANGKTNLTESHFTKARNTGRSLLLRLYYFDQFTTTDLPDKVLAQINSDFALFRQHGCKAILRFAYTADDETWPIQDASPAIWKRHLEQLKPVLRDNADVIAVVQAGFMGAWGEWYYSSEGTGEEIAQSVKNNLINQLLDAVPVSRAVQLRTPEYKRSYLGKNNDAALDSVEAFTGTARARLGHHNDAFLYGKNNMGTYTNRTSDMAYLAEECLYLPNGGECDVNKEDVYKDWATGDKAQAEMAQLHYSYLNDGYAELTINHWREDGSYDILARNMGYRLELVQSNLPVSIERGTKAAIQITLRNVGYAPMYNERPVYLVLHNDDTTYSIPLYTDPRRWLPNGAETLIADSILLSMQVQAGDYDAYLWLPDMFEAIRQDARFAVRFANKNVWDEQTGYNSLLTSITITDPETPYIPEPQADVAPVTNLSINQDNGNALLTWSNPNTTGVDTLTVDLSLGTGIASSAGSANVSYLNKVSKTNYSTSSAWHWAGVEYPVDSLENILAIQFEFKGDGNEYVIYPYAWDGDYRWRSNEFYDLSSTDWQQVSDTPAITLWADDPTHDFGDQPVTKLGFVVNPASTSSGTFSIRDLKVITESQAPAFAGVQIIRKEGSAPTSIADGTVVYTGTGTSFTDSGLKSGTTYYYAAYAYNILDQIAYPAIDYVTMGGTTSLQSLPDNDDHSKFIRNGILYIQRNGCTYTLLGYRL